MKEAKQFSVKSIDAIEKAIWKYEEFTNQADFGLYNDDQAIAYKKYLATKMNDRSKKTLSITSQYHYLRHVEAFITWLAGQPRYKSRISLLDVEYLKLGRKESRLATSPKLPKYPSLEQVLTLCSFPVDSEIDQRDRAMIAFSALTGMRDQAIVTLPIGCFDPEKMMVSQLPSKGVQTKFSKDIYTTIFKVDEKLVSYFIDWYDYLLKVKKFSITDPLFPSTELGTEGPESFSFIAKGVSKTFWSSAGVMRKIFEARSEQVGIPYFTPHKFRHFIINETQKHITSIEQLKALSQNLGHQNISTTFHGYGSIDTYRVNTLVNEMDFSSKPDSSRDAQIKHIETLLKQLKEK
jgi:integrase